MVNRERAARLGGGGDRGLEQQQHAVGLVDLLPVPLAQQVARQAVVPGRELRVGLVAQLLVERGAVDQVGQQQSPFVVHVASLSPRCSMVHAVQLLLHLPATDYRLLEHVLTCMHCHLLQAR